MLLSKLVEIWDSFLYVVYNCIAYIKYFINYINIKKIIKKNNNLKGMRNTDRCFIVLNGPSVNMYDLDFLKNETVFCANYMYKTQLSSKIEPNYYCLLDSGLYENAEFATDMINEVLAINDKVQLILNIKGHKVIGNRNRVFYTYNKYMPNMFNLVGNMTGMFPGFQNVSLYMIMSAIYMGYKKIYLLGLDFEPTGFSHFTNDCGPVEDRNQYSKKEDVCGLFFQYLKAQYETFYVKKYAEKKGVHIYNCNPKSYVRAFDFNLDIQLDSKK